MKKLSKVLIVILLLFVSVSVSASVTVKDRNDFENYGVNKKWKINESNKSNVLSTPLVNVDDKIYDFADAISDYDEINLKNIINNFVSKTNMDMVIVTINEPYYSDAEMEEFAADFYDYNDFGLNFEKYSGVLLLRNASLNNRYYNIYTFGEAQLYFSYERLEYTLDDIYDDIYNDEYLSGFTTFINKMENYYVDNMGFLKEKYNPPIFMSLIISAKITGIVMYILISKNKMVRKASAANDYLEKETINYTQKRDDFITTRTTSHRINTGSSSSGGRSSSRGSSGGGHSRGGGRRG